MKYLAIILVSFLFSGYEGTQMPSSTIDLNTLWVTGYGYSDPENINIESLL